MSLLQTGVAEAASYLRWVVDKRLQAIEEFALDPQGFGIGCPGIVDAKTRLHLASLRGDKEAEREAIVDLIRAETRELWSGTSELKLLTVLYRRADRRKRRKRRNELADSRRPTEHQGGPQGLRGVCWPELRPSARSTLCMNPNSSQKPWYSTFFTTPRGARLAT